MFASFTNYEDVKKYYEKTFIKLPDLGDEIVHVDRVTPERMEVTNPLTKEPIWVMLKTRPYELSFVLPRKTVYQMDNNAVMLSRIPARMWKKGLTHANTQFQTLGVSSWALSDFNINMIVKFVNKPTYLSFAEAKHGFENSNLQSAAMSKRVSLSLNGNVYVDSVLVGRLAIKENVLTTRSLFVPTLKPLFSTVDFKVLK